MGGNAAARLRDLGFDLVVFDSRPDQMAGHPAEQAASVKELAAQSDVILAFLPYSSQVESVAIGPEGVLDGARPGTIFVNMGTISPKTTRLIADALATRGVDVLGAPMNGGPHVAREGRL